MNTVGGVANSAVDTVGGVANNLLRNGQVLDLARAGLTEVSRTVNSAGQTVRRVTDSSGQLLEVVTDTANRIVQLAKGHALIPPRHLPGRGTTRRVVEG